MEIDDNAASGFTCADVMNVLHHLAFFHRGFQYLANARQLLRCYIFAGDPVIRLGFQMSFDLRIFANRLP
ncbi:hypothetical protein D3C81_1985150 [compost metagenome]